MNVYLVEEFDYDDYTFHGCFATKELAEEFRDALDSAVDIREVEVTDLMPHKYTAYRHIMDDTLGTLTEYSDNFMYWSHLENELNFNTVKTWDYGNNTHMLMSYSTESAADAINNAVQVYKELKENLNDE